LIFFIVRCIDSIKTTHTEVDVNKFILSAVALCLLLLAPAITAQNLKLGFVDSQKIFEGLPEAQAAQKQLDARLQQWQDTLEVMSRNYLADFEAYQAQQGAMSTAAKEERQQELLRMQQAVQDYRTAKFGQGGEAARMRIDILNPLQQKVLEAIEEVAKEEKINFMFDKLEDAAILLYADAKFDYTFKVLDRLKRGAK
jgi:outer membrane protein